MSTENPKTLQVDEFIKSATMFYIDPTLELKYEDLIDHTVDALQKKLLKISTLDDLKNYIRKDPDSLKNIISLLNISTEKFKRIITMIRLGKNHVPTSEWDLSKTREQMISDPFYMNEICDLLYSGATNKKYTSLIPKFYLEKFLINMSTLGRLVNHDDVRRLVKKGLEGAYNNQLGDSYFSFVASRITTYCEKFGIQYQCKKNVPICDKNMSIVIPKAESPRIIIDITYGITTSSTQTQYAKRAEVVSSKIREYNKNMDQTKTVIFVNVIDGAGWVARLADLSKIQRCSDFLINLKNLSIIESVINSFCLGA